MSDKFGTDLTAELGLRIQTVERLQIVRHALRYAYKKGDPRALALMSL